MHNRQNDFSVILRRETNEAHRRVDEVFAHFDLANRHDYRRFLLSHHRVVPFVEAAIGDVEGAPAFERRGHHLKRDLAELGVRIESLECPPSMPALPFRVSSAEAHGMLYVLEGSRLGGRLLERSVEPNLPRRYLSAGHLAGEWQAFRTGLDEWACQRTVSEKSEALAAAIFCFSLFEKAAKADDMNSKEIRSSD